MLSPNCTGGDAPPHNGIVTARPAGLLQQPADDEHGDADAGDRQRILDGDLFRSQDVAGHARPAG